MQNRFPVLLAAAAFLILLSAQANAQETARHKNFEDVPSYFFMHLKKLPAKDSYMSFFTKEFDAAAQKRDRITAQDIDRARAPLKEELQELYWMMAKQMDDNGNDLIERAEIERQSQIKNMPDSPSNRNKLLEAVGAWTMYDADGDGVLTREEATALTKGRIVYGFPYEVWLSMNVPDFLVLDDDKDGILHRAQFLAQAEKTFNTFDVNGDGTLSAEEMKVFSTMSVETDMTLEDQILMNDLIEFRGKKFCELPEPERGAQTILITMPMGTLSSVAVLDETERTSASEVVIDEKVPKTYLVLQSNTPTIWRIAGDVAKVTHAVVVGPENAFDKKTYSAVVGLPEEKVTFASEMECTATMGDMMRPERLWRTVKVLETALGRQFTAKEIYGLLVRATVSDGAVTGLTQNKMPPEVAPDGFDAVMWQNYVSSFHEHML